jgi:hypothetical protein
VSAKPKQASQEIKEWRKTYHLQHRSYYQTNILLKERKHGNFTGGAYTVPVRQHVRGRYVPEHAQFKVIVEKKTGTHFCPCLAQGHAAHVGKADRKLPGMLRSHHKILPKKRKGLLEDASLWEFAPKGTCPT